MTAESPSKSRFGAKQVLLLVLVVGSTAAVFLLDLDRYLTFETLKAYREQLVSFVAQHRFLAILLYIAVYAASTALSVPGGAVLTATGGFLFGILFGATFAVIGATLGAMAIFLIARTALGEPLRARAGPTLKKMEAGFNENAVSYMLVLRLIPLFPFFLVNIVPAFLGVSLKIYALTTFVGIIPGTLVYATVGAGLGSIFDANEAFSLEGVLTPEIIAALVGLAVLSLLPVAYKASRRRAATPPSPPPER